MASDIECTMQERYERYCNDLEENYNDIIPPTHRDKYCLLFGHNIMHTASTLEEAVSLAESAATKHVLLVIVKPSKE